MLSRTAQGLYWMGRYLERTEHQCRLLRLQTETLMDRPLSEIYFGWKRIYKSLNRDPVVGDLQPEAEEDFMLVDSYTLTDDLTFDRANPQSIWSCFAHGRENARQMRDCISAEMWTSLNLAYLRVQGIRIEDIWKAAPESFYDDLIRDINAFSGVAEASMYRDDGWRFFQIGRCIERSQLALLLLLVQLDLDANQDESFDVDWTSLLRLYNAFEAYSSRHGISVHADKVVDLLVADASLPGSVSRSLDILATEIAAVEPGPSPAANTEVQQLIERLRTWVRYEWSEQKDQKVFLHKLQEYNWQLHRLLFVAHIDYPVT